MAKSDKKSKKTASQILPAPPLKLMKSKPATAKEILAKAKAQAPVSKISEVQLYFSIVTVFSAEWKGEESSHAL
jgi:hypothetical protein